MALLGPRIAALGARAVHLESMAIVVLAALLREIIHAHGAIDVLIILLLAGLQVQSHAAHAHIVGVRLNHDHAGSVCLLLMLLLLLQRLLCLQWQLLRLCGLILLLLQIVLRVVVELVAAIAGMAPLPVASGPVAAGRQ